MTNVCKRLPVAVVSTQPSTYDRTQRIYACVLATCISVLKKKENLKIHPHTAALSYTAVSVSSFQCYITFSGKPQIPREDRNERGVCCCFYSLKSPNLQKNDVLFPLAKYPWNYAKPKSQTENRPDATKYVNFKTTPTYLKKRGWFFVAHMRWYFRQCEKCVFHKTATETLDLWFV